MKAEAQNGCGYKWSCRGDRGKVGGRNAPGFPCFVPSNLPQCPPLTELAHKPGAMVPEFIVTHS